MSRRTSAISLTNSGRTQTLAEWAREKGMGYETLYTRVIRRGWRIEVALSAPTGCPVAAEPKRHSTGWQRMAAVSDTSRKFGLDLPGQSALCSVVTTNGDEWCRNS